MTPGRASLGGRRFVIFDLDGTLVDSTRDLAAAVNATLEALAPGTPPLPVPTVRTYIGNGAGELVRRSLAQAGLEVSAADALRLFLEKYRDCLLDTTVLYPGVVEALEALRPRTLAVLSNKPGDLSRAILQGLGIAEHFARICGGGDLPGRKPDPALLLGLLAELGGRPEEAVVVGDSAVDVRTARGAGVAVIGVSYGLDPESLRADPPDALVDDLRQLPELC